MGPQQMPKVRETDERTQIVQFALNVVVDLYRFSLILLTSYLL